MTIRTILPLLFSAGLTLGACERAQDPPSTPLEVSSPRPEPQISQPEEPTDAPPADESRDSYDAPAPRDSYDAPAPRDSPDSGTKGERLAEPPSGSAPEAAAGSSRERSSDAAPKRRAERPGLGTEWGETRDSRVSSTSFTRSDWYRPLSTSTFFYDDEAGVRAALGSAPAWDDQRAGATLADGALSVRIVNASGSSLPTYVARGRNYVVGELGERYSIRVENRSGARFEAVASVDGLDVIDGQPGSVEKRGYVVAPWSTVKIDGFRRSHEEVAAFRFGRVRDSYAARRGNDRNVGVIGVAVFRERGAPWPWNPRELSRRESADPFPGRFAPPPPPRD